MRDKVERSYFLKRESEFLGLFREIKRWSEGGSAASYGRREWWCGGDLGDVVGVIKILEWGNEFFRERMRESEWRERDFSF